jgi:hypothetical protein
MSNLKPTDYGEANLQDQLDSSNHMSEPFLPTSHQTATQFGWSNNRGSVTTEPLLASLQQINEKNMVGGRGRKAWFRADRLGQSQVEINLRLQQTDFVGQARPTGKRECSSSGSVMVNNGKHAGKTKADLEQTNVGSQGQLERINPKCLKERCLGQGQHICLEQSMGQGKLRNVCRTHTLSHRQMVNKTCMCRRQIFGVKVNW